ncbi:MAG: sn-glycerol-1-phosphate dehydrogenase, partial [Candidatus Caldatribacteriaceae bacterium]
ALLICDENTYHAAGTEVETILQEDHLETLPCLLQKKPNFYYLEPDEEARGQIGDLLRQNPNFLIAVGSGVINDLTKFVAHRVSLPFLVVATAPSMDGYSSPGAPMMVGGYKVTYSATPPQAILMDLGIVSQAPFNLIQAGLLDLLGKVTANADWIMRHTIWQEYFCKDIWQMTKKNLLSATQEAENLPQRDHQAIYELSIALLNSGFAMDMVGDSRPASGAEHLVAHYLEIMALHRGIHPSLHGLRVGTATVLIRRMYQRFLTEMPILFEKCYSPSPEKKLEVVKTHFGPLFPLVEEITRKKLTITIPQKAKEEKFQKDLKKALQEPIDLLPNLEEIIQKAQAPESLFHLGFSRKMVQEAFLFARFLRERATLLDFLDQAGVLEEYVDWALTKN